MSKAGDKRAAGNADDEFPFTDEQVQTLEKSQKDLERIEYAIERDAQKKLDAAYETRRPVLKSIPGFWPAAFKNHAMLAAVSIQAEDVKALSFLEDVWVWRDPKEHRAYGFEFHFAPNPFFSDAVLKKEYKYVAPQDEEALKEDENGVSEANINFDQTRDTEPTATPINWKDPAKALTKLYPRVYDPEDKESIEDHGSFFNIFEHKDNEGDIEQSVALDWYPNVVDYFFNRGENSIGNFEDDDEDDEEDGSDDEDIDLENPKKKAKN